MSTDSLVIKFTTSPCRMLIKQCTTIFCADMFISIESQAIIMYKKGTLKHIFLIPLCYPKHKISLFPLTSYDLASAYVEVTALVVCTIILHSVELEPVVHKRELS